MRPSINLRRWLKTAPWPFSLLPASIPLPSLLWILLLVVANIALFSHLRGNAPWQNKSTSIKTVGRSQPAHRPACVQIIKTDKFQINSCVRTGKHTLLISRVDRRECVASLEKRTSMDAELETRNKKRIGPDSYYVILDGPERVVPTARYIPHCMMSFDLSARHTGTYNLTVFHYATDFAAAIEIGQKYDFVANKKLLLTSHIVDITASPQPPTGSQRQCPREGNLPAGSFTRTEPQLPHTPSHKWTPLCAYEHPSTTLSKAGTCQAKTHSIAFIGDTPARDMYRHAFKRLTGSARAPPSTHFTEGPLTLAHIQDDFLRDILAGPETLDGYTKVVLSFGSAPFAKASEGGHWKMNQYKTHFANVLGVLTSYAKTRVRPLQVLVAGIPAPLLDAGGWRGPERMRYAQEVVREMSVAVGVEVVDAFGLTISWILEAEKGKGTPGMEAVMDEVLHRLNLCSGKV